MEKKPNPESRQKSYSFVLPVTNMRSSPERVFIYVIMLNSDQLEGNKPFYVDWTDNLSKRLANHRVLNWHKDRFNTPAKVWVAGTVDFKYANYSVDALNVALLRSNHLMFLTDEFKAEDVEAQVDPDGITPTDIRKYSISALKAYSHKKLAAEKVFAKWSKSWAVKGQPTSDRTPEVRRADDSVKTQFENAALLAPSKLGLISFVQRSKYKTNAATRASQTLAHNYDERTGLSTITFRGHDLPARDERRVKDAVEAAQGISADWVPLEPIQTRTPIRFHLTTNVKRAVAPGATRIYQ